MFDRLRNSTLSEDTSEVLVQLLYCSTEKATSVARVVVKLTPRLCVGVLATPKFTQEAQALWYMEYHWSSFRQKKDLTPRWCSYLPNTLDWRYALLTISGVPHHSIQCFSHPSVQIFQSVVQPLPDPQERL